MKEADDLLGFGSAQATVFPSLVTLSSPIPSSRRLSSQFTPSRPVPSARKLAWVSLQGRLVNAEEASSARAIGGGLSREEKVAWQLFSPAQRFLIVAVIGVAVAESRKNRLISQLKKSVALRDQVLSSMQQKLDNLCEQVNNFNNQAGTRGNKNIDSLSNDAFGSDKIKFVDCGCWHCDQHQDLFSSLMKNCVVKVSKGDEMLQYKFPFANEVEHDERRMSDLSDWASSVTSTAEIQTNSFSVDQDILNLKRECEEKGATIKELTTILQSTNITGSKRITELEDVIRKKNFMITKLKKDMAVLEQRVVHLTRLRRPSFSKSTSESLKIPALMDNIVYDMDSSTSLSSSDSDSSPANRAQASVVNIQATPAHDTANSPSSSDSDSSPVKRLKGIEIQDDPSAILQIQKPDMACARGSTNSPFSFDLDSSAKPSQFPTIEIQETPASILKIQKPDRSSDLGSPTKQKLLPTRASSSLASTERLIKSRSTERLTKSTSTDHLIKSRSESPLKEISTNQKSTSSSSLRPKQLSISGEFKKTRRRTQVVPKDEAPKKRWH